MGGRLAAEDGEGGGFCDGGSEEGDQFLQGGGRELMSERMECMAYFAFAGDCSVLRRFGYSALD